MLQWLRLLRCLFLLMSGSCRKEETRPLTVELAANLDKGCLMTNAIRTVLIFCVLMLDAAWAQSESEHSDHSTRHAIDWPGVYQGLLPCADYEGVETTLMLRADHSYTLIRRRLGEVTMTDEVSGSFMWKADGGVVMLGEPGEAPALYQVGEDHLRQLDREGQRIAGPLAENYVLHKVGPMLTAPLEGVRWMLTEVDGGPVQVAPDGKRPYFVLGKDASVKGFAGCNTFSGQYRSEGEGSFDLSQLVSTMMACPQLETEQKFLRVLELADRYELVGTSLFLYQGEGMLAKLRAAVVSD
jgi:copper homeostasis protein (lipoprotein)